MASPAVKLMIESGMVPNNLLRQLVGWRLIPEALEQSSGGHPVTLENEWNSVEDFVRGLRSALRSEAATIRETELDRVGGFKDGVLHYALDTSCLGEMGELFVDRLGRVILPSHPRYEDVKAVDLDGVKKQVARIDARYEGEERVAWVLELKGDQNEPFSTNG
jgi:hypothetical protein